MHANDLRIVDNFEDKPDEVTAIAKVRECAVEVRNATLQYPLLDAGRGSIKTAIMQRLGHREKVRKPQMVEALCDVSVSFSKGDRIGIIGSNGAGKSTFLRTLAGVYPLQSGSVRVTGRLGTLLDIGLGFEVDSTGRENIYYRGMAMGIPPRELRAVEQEIIDFAQLGEFIDYPVRTYSSGMYVRLGFAISTQMTPDVLLIDEVFGAGDASFQQRAMKRMMQIVDHAGIVVLATHDLQLIQALCTRVLWLSKGQILRDGPPTEVVPQFLAHSAEPVEG